jgi:hypothetical protein
VVRWVWLALFCSKLAQATAIVAVVFPGAVYIAADSRLTKTAASGGPATSSEGCKIVQTPVAAFAVSALSSDSRTGFDFGEITRGALAAASGPLDARIEEVEQALAPKMKATVDGIRQDFPKLYESFRKGKVGQAVFAAWEDGHPVLIEDDWEITPEGEIRQERFRATDEQNLLIIGSGGDAILRYVNQNSDWWKVPAPEALDRLIHAAIDDAAATHADDVGGEIAILTIDANGQRWVRTGKCGEQR